MPTSTDASAASKPGEAKSRLFDSLRAKAKPTNAPADPTPAPVATPQADTTAPKTEDVETPTTETTPASEPSPPTKDKSAKVSPWKLVDEYKGKVAKLEAEIAKAGDSAKLSSEVERLTKRAAELEAKTKEYEDEIRFTNYSKSEEFKTKHVEPYTKAWQRAMGELKELTVMDPATNQQRAISVQDMVELVNMPLPKAREAAVQVFGDFADDVMAHRKEIRNLFESQQAALEEARKTGAEREKTTMEQRQQQQTALQKTIQETWTSENEAASKHEKYGKYFRPIEGDEEFNQRLSKGFELADRAFSENPSDPRLTQEQRASIIRRHAAVRNRAASWGAIRTHLEKAQSRIAELEKELKQYQESGPETGGRTAAQATATPASTRDSVFGSLRKLAK